MMPFDGADDLMLEMETTERRVRWWLRATLAAACLFLAAAILGLSWTNARAQNQASDCSGTVGATAAAVSFARGQPTQYVFITNPHASASLWLSVTTTAAANAQGSMGLTSTGSYFTLPPMPTVSIVASAGSTPYTCFYR